MQKLPRLDAKDVQKELIEPAVKGTEAKWPNPEEWNWSKIEGFRLTCATDRHIQASYKILLQQCFDRNMLVRRQDDRDDLYNFIRKHMIHFLEAVMRAASKALLVRLDTFGRNVKATFWTSRVEVGWLVRPALTALSSPHPSLRLGLLWHIWRRGLENAVTTEPVPTLHQSCLESIMDMYDM